MPKHEADHAKREVHLDRKSDSTTENAAAIRPSPDRPTPRAHAGPSPESQVLSPADRAFYLRALDVLDRCGIRYCVAGAYCLAHYAGIIRHTKDLDIFIGRADVVGAFEAFEAVGFVAEMTHPHWLGKVFEGKRADQPKSPDEAPAFIDLIFRSANGMCDVDDEWLNHAEPGEVLGRSAPLCPVEEMIWSKSWVMARERFDGADIAHLLLHRGDRIDWDRLLRRFRGGEPILLGHLAFFQYIYPSERTRVPSRVLDILYTHLRQAPAVAERVCRGTSLSWDQYDIDVNEWSFADGRIDPLGPLTRDEVERWTRAAK